MQRIREMIGVATLQRAMVLLVLAGGCASAQTSANEPARVAWAELKNGRGESVGSALFWEQNGRVRIVVQASGLTPGRHGIHVHAMGRCEPPAFESAGEHLNPLGKRHGLENPEGPHVGDLPAVEADANGQTEYVAVTDRLTLGPGPNSVFDADGSALVIHASPDDEMTDPAGNSGARIACGVLAAPISGT